jgi:hypothetical protein
MPENVFYLHEDEWGMVTLLPIENRAWALETAREAQEFGEAHFDGFGWTDIYVIPTEVHPLSERCLPFARLQTLLGDRLPLASKVQSGYSSHTEDLPGSFAFGEANLRTGAFYGSHDDGIVTTLHLLLPDSGNSEMTIFFADCLSALGMEYDLMLADWWSHEVLDLSDKASLLRHLHRGSSE